MGFIDLILFPLYLLLFNLFFSWRRKYITDPVLKKYHKQGFWIKVTGTLAFTIFHTVFSPGNDSTGLYYTEGVNIARLISADFSNIKLIMMPGTEFDQTLLFDPYNSGYFRNDSNFFVTRLVTILSFFSFRSYIVINLFFSLISFSGVWKLYRFFYEQYPHLHKKLAIAILYLPTLVFWSSGILKDPLSIGFLGWMTYSLYRVSFKKQIIKNLLIAFFSAYVVVIVKSYILVSYLPFFIFYIVLSNFNRIKRASLKVAVFFGLILFGSLGFFVVADKLQEELGNLALDKLSESVKKQQTTFINISDIAESSFSLGVEFDGSNTSLIKMAPAAIIATFYRPYLWESKKVSTLLSSLESLTLMIFTLYVFLKAGPFLFFKSIFTHSMVMFCFFFSVLFALFVGATTLNFGTLVRYKIPCMPFYIIALVLIQEIYKKRKAAAKLKEAAL